MDPAWNNLSAYIISLRDRVRLVSWEEPLLGCLGGHLYGVTPDGVVANVEDSELETIIELKISDLVRCLRGRRS